MVKVPLARVNSRDILGSMLINNSHSILKTRILVAGLQIHLVFYYKFFSTMLFANKKKTNKQQEAFP